MAATVDRMEGHVQKRTIGLRAAVIALVVVPGFMVTTSAIAATVTSTAESQAAHARAGRITDNITVGSCTTARKTWVHITMSTGTKCYGGTGTLVFSTNVTTRVCTGNNRGVLEYTDGSTLNFWDFVPGEIAIFTPSADIKALTISGSSGSDSC